MNMLNSVRSFVCGDKEALAKVRSLSFMKSRFSNNMTDFAL
jgi:hypothetical protein